jgi:hypothetical protein
MLKNGFQLDESRFTEAATDLDTIDARLDPLPRNSHGHDKAPQPATMNRRNAEALCRF